MPAESPLRHSRRDLLRAGLVMGGLGILRQFLPGLLEQAQAGERRKFKRLIYLWGDGGGPSLPDFNDPKESGNPHVDTIYPSVETKVPGLKLTEPFRALASLMQHIVSFRARVTNDLNHPTAIAAALRRQEPSGEHLLSKVARMQSGMPFVYAEPPGVINAFNYRRDSFSVQIGVEAPWCPERQQYIPPSFGESHPNHMGRQALRKELEALSKHSPQNRVAKRMEEHMETAHRLIARGKEAAVSTSDEDMRRYSNGEKPTPGTLLPLLARDLIRKEIASVVIVRTGFHGAYGSFDHHDDLQGRMAIAAPQFAHSIAQLLEDHLSGMLPDTVIAFDTEFGRTPKIGADIDNSRPYPVSHEAHTEQAHRTSDE